MAGRTIPRFVLGAAERWPERPFLLGEPALTYAACVEQARLAAGALAARGVRRGDRVLLVLPNGPDFLFAWWGANLLGALVVPANPALRPGELAYLVHHAEPRLAVVGVEHADLLAAAVAEAGAGASLPHILLAGPGADDPATSFARARAEAAPPSSTPHVDEADPAVIIYTSGTTGRPKGVMQTHRAYVLVGESFGWWLGLGEAERMWTCLPLHHINAQAYSTMGAVGGGHALALRPRFSASAFWDDVRAHGATQFNAIGAMLHILLRQPERPDDPDNPARVCYAALALPAEQHQAFERRFGLRMLVGYGLSESPFGTIWPRQQPPRYGSIGLPRQHPTLGAINQARVVDDAGQDVAEGTGEVWLRNPAIMAGYYRDEARTAETVVDGWLRTGDLVRREADGWLTFVARKGDIIRRRGENLSAAEIEACLVGHPRIQDAAVLAVPSDLGEDEVKAYVVPAPEQEVTPEEVVAWCAERLAAFKVPRYVEVRPDLPRTETQRVAKHALRAEIAAGAPLGWDRLAASPPGGRA